MNPAAPEIHIDFPDWSAWFPWAQRQEVPGITREHGVYLLGRFDSAPGDDPDPTDESIIYIGETCDRPIWNRLRAFNRCAFPVATDERDSPLKGHDAGLRYAEVFGCTPDKLFVSIAACPLCLFDPLTPDEDGQWGARSTFIQYHERRLLWEYRQVRRHLPIFNAT